MELEKIQFENGIPLKIKIQSIERYPIHWHKDVTEIILPVRGSVEVKSNMESVTLEEGDFFIVNNKSIHAIKSNDTSSIVLLFFIDLNYFEEQFAYIKHMFFRNSIHQDLLGSDKIIIENNEKFIIYFRNLLISILLESYNRTISDFMYNELIHKLIYQMIYEFNWLQLLKKDGEFISSEHLDRYHRIVKYIDENYSQKISLDDIVNMEFISKTYFSHFWKNISTYSFNERINYERVLKSEFLLFEDMTITEISYKCGFSDVKYYYRDFKKWYGCMPLEHRDRCNLYQANGYKYKELDYYGLKEIINKYIDRFLLIEDIYEEDMVFSALIDKHLYLKYYHTIQKETSSTPKFIVLDPFKYIAFDENNKKTIFNWTTLDLLVNLILDFEFVLQIKLSSDKVKSCYFREYTSNLINSIINRYGSEVLNKSHFLINYKDSISSDGEQPIEELITSLVDNVNISYYIEP